MLSMIDWNNWGGLMSNKEMFIIVRSILWCLNVEMPTDEYIKTLVEHNIDKANEVYGKKEVTNNESI